MLDLAVGRLLRSELLRNVCRVSSRTCMEDEWLLTFVTSINFIPIGACPTIGVTFVTVVPVSFISPPTATRAPAKMTEVFDRLRVLRLLRLMTVFAIARDWLINWISRMES